MLEYATWRLLNLLNDATSWETKHMGIALNNVFYGLHFRTLCTLSAFYINTIEHAITTVCTGESH